MEKDQLFWSLEDYQRFLQHPDVLARTWAADRIEHQYPQHAAELFLPLLNDPDPHLRIEAAQAIEKSGDPRYEAALLDALPEEPGLFRFWVLHALGRVRSPTYLPQLVAILDAADAQPPKGLRRELTGVIDALGCYPEAEARAALWRFVERHPYHDFLNQKAFHGLLRFPDPTTIPRLVQRYNQLTPGEAYAWLPVIASFAEVVGVKRLSDEVIRSLAQDLYAALEEMEAWLTQRAPFSDALAAAIEAAEDESYTELLSPIAAEIARIASERGDDLDAWRAAWAAGEPPVGYRWRMLYAYEVAAAFAAHPPADEKKIGEAAGLSLALLGQAALDRDDEAALQAAPDEEARRTVLLDILASPRQNVMPDVAERVAALGPDAVPRLVEVLEDGPFWALPRALEALTQIAQSHPSAADAAIPVILDLIYDDQSDYVLEPASEALRAIGPAIIEPVTARLGRGDLAYDIYTLHALAEIPVEASLNTLLKYSREVEFTEMEIELLTDLGHPRAIPLLRPYHNRRDPRPATALYTIGLLNGYTGPEMDEWGAVAHASHERFAHSLESDSEDLLSPPAPPAEPQPKAARSRRRSRRRQRKKRRAEAKARRRAQRKRKKKRRR